MRLFLKQNILPSVSWIDFYVTKMTIPFQGHSHCKVFIMAVSPVHDIYIPGHDIYILVHIHYHIYTYFDNK